MLGKSKAKYIQSLGQKKHRDEEGVFIAEGPKIVAELLASGNTKLVEVFALPNWIEAQSNDFSKTTITEIDEIELAKISQLQTPNQVLAVVKKFETPSSFHSKGIITLALDTIQDPGNLGTMIRIADWFGVSQIVCNHGCADLYNPKVVQSTMGSISRVAVCYEDLAGWLSLQKDTRVYATFLEGHDVTKMSKLQEGIIVIGNESKGIGDDVAGKINVRITIPQKGKAESLNAAVAAGIVLSHLL